MDRLEDIAAIRLTIASPEQIRSWSYGEIVVPDTLDYKTLRPVEGGLFCERIFGPIKDWSCACGAYIREHLPGVICETCGVEVAPSSVRRERLGHIELAAPIAHTWFARGAPSRIGLLLDMTPRLLQLVLSYACSIVVSLDEQEREQELLRIDEAIERLDTGIDREEGETDEQRRAGFTRLKNTVKSLQVGVTLPEEEVRWLRSTRAHHVCTISSGGEAVRDLLARVDLDELSRTLRRTIAEGESTACKKAMKRLKVVEAFRQSRSRPEWMVYTNLPVLPPELRPMVPLGGGRFATSDLNDLYTRVINRNNRIKKLVKMRAPQLIINNEKRLLQEACNALIDNKRRKQPLLGSRNHPLKSLTDTLSGKEGRFRRNLLGKRVDYSGRSVISVGLNLHIHQCGLPMKIALELYKPFVLRKLLDRNLAGKPRQAKRMIERKDPVVWDLLEEVMEGTCVLLNRAPTLHRLSIQAFEPILVEGGAIRLHPLVCSPFNADFDGDQMAVHLPLSDEAQREARELMLSTRNLRSPATGEPSISISQEMVLGCFYLTQERPHKKGEGRLFSNALEALIAYEHGNIDLQARITVRLYDEQIINAPPPDTPRKIVRGQRIETTVGRIIFNETLPEPLRFKNFPMKKDNLKQVVAECLRECGQDKTAEVANTIKDIGFRYATKSGISFSVLSDIVVPPERAGILAQADARVQEIKAEYHNGMITDQERYNQVIEIWNEATERISKRLEEILDPYGNIYTIAKSGATKAKFQQIRQLSGMRGLMSSPSGRIIEIPIQGNYLIGLTVAEYMIGSHGARKGAMDRSLNTAKSGYRTRILVEVGQQVSITMHDCGTRDGILITQEESTLLGLPDMLSRIVSRCLAEPINDLRAGSALTEKLARALLDSGATIVRVRSPLTCQAPHGVCRLCYGLDLSSGNLVQKGAAVGIIAAQSIGEPGTQLTMRTFHSGGIAGAQGDITQGQPRIDELFEARVPKGAATLAQIDGTIDIRQGSEAGHQNVYVVSRQQIVDDYLLPLGCTLSVNDGEHIEDGQELATSQLLGPTVARCGGTAHIFSETHLSICYDSSEERVHTIPQGKKLIVTQGQKVIAGSPLTAGALSPQELLTCAGTLAAQRYLVNEIQHVYRTTGVYLHDKHSETLVRQMLRHVLVTEAGDTSFVPGSLMDQFVYTEGNAQALAQGGTPATAHPVLLGTIKTALYTESWIASASFQETSRVLTDAAIEGRIDRLRGLKEAVVLGRKIPSWEGNAVFTDTTC